MTEHMNHTEEATPLSSRKRGPDGRLLPNEDDMLRAMEADPSMMGRFLAKFKNSPVLTNIAKRNLSAIKLGAEHRVGTAILGRVREGIIRPVLPENMQPVMDNTLVKGGVDVGLGLLISVLYEMYGEKLPEKMQEYAELLTEAVTYAAWSDVFGRFDLEGLFTKLLSGDIMDMLDELKKNRAKVVS